MSIVSWHTDTPYMYVYMYEQTYWHTDTLAKDTQLRKQWRLGLCGNWVFPFCHLRWPSLFSFRLFLLPRSQFASKTLSLATSPSQNALSVFSYLTSTAISLPFSQLEFLGVLAPFYSFIPIARSLAAVFEPILLSLFASSAGCSSFVRIPRLT